jgi:hypothetical protein
LLAYTVRTGLLTSVTAILVLVTVRILPPVHLFETLSNTVPLVRVDA